MRFFLSKMNKTCRDYFKKIIGTSGKVNDEFVKTEGALYRLFVFAFVSVVLIFVVNIIFISTLNHTGMGKVGAWGDFFGGVLNPVLTFLTFTGLLITIILQQTELREARQEFKRSANALELQHKATNKQSFEATFFQMLTLHNTIVESLQAAKGANGGKEGTLVHGRECFNIFYTELSDIHKEKVKKKSAPYTGNPKETIQAAYKVFWNDRSRILAHYYRYLYNVIRFVRDSDFCDDTYLRLIRAQLSDQELLLLFYNCLTEQGSNFKDLVEKFSILDNLDPRYLLDNKHENLIAKTAFKKTT